jgi:hypothetical protein
MFAINSLRNRCRRKQGAAYRPPRLEVLEDRTLPAILNITALTSGFTPTNNNYTILNNALQAAHPGDILILSGQFDWTEPNAFNSWALGSDGLASGDDFFLTVPHHLDNLTVEAATAGGAAIIGPGNRPATDTEGFLRFVAGPGDHNRGWTISNLTIAGFDLSIAMFNGAGSSNNAFSGTQIINNFIQVPAAVNASAAGAPIVTPNIGILFGFGKNQRIANNTLAFPGNGLSDSLLNHPATSVGILSNYAGGDVYNGLDIEGNTLQVQNAPSADPEHLVGIWENGNAPASNITVKNNQFLNLAAGNDPTKNVQFGFLVTSHSSASTTVVYTGNLVRGANVAFDWASGAGVDFSGTLPVQLINNTAIDVVTGVVVQSGGSALLQNDTLSGHGNAGTGVDVEPGSTANFVSAGGGDQISAFLSGIDVKGSAAVTGVILTGNGVGLRVSPGGQLATATSNSITGNAVGVLITAGAGSVGNLLFNTLTGNTNFGVDNESATMVNATPDFWGDTTGPRQPALNPTGLGNPVSAGVSFLPWGVDPNDFTRVTFPPSITFLNLSPATITEGQTTTLTGTFSDPDAAQGHTLQVDWGDGSGTVFSVGPGGTTIGPFTHLYANDQPLGYFLVTVKVTDDLGARDLKTVAVTVKDLPPVLVSLRVNPAAPLQDHLLALVGTFSNGGTGNTFTLVVDWNDGSPKQTFALPAGATAFAPTHVYARPGTYTVNLSVADASGGGFTATQPVKVTAVTKATSEQLYVQRLAVDLLGHPVSPPALVPLLDRLTRGMSREKVALKLQQSNDYRVKVVQDLYQEILGRPASPAETVRQARALARQESIEQLEAFLLGSLAYYRKAGSPVAFLQALYRDAVGQEIAPLQLSTYLTQLERGVSRAKVAARVLATGPAREKLVNDLYLQFLLRPATPNELAAALRLLRRGHRDQLIASITGSDAYFNLG